jgi:hypothetical protein
MHATSAILPLEEAARLGYTYDNCVPCCFEINRAKSDISFSGFLALIKDAATNLKLVN